MRIQIVLFILFTASIVGCASSKKNESGPTSAGVTSPSTAAPAVPVSTPTSGVSNDWPLKMICRSGKDERVLTIEKSAPIGCKLKYSRFSDQDPVAWSFKGPGHCEKVRAQIRKNLEIGGFTCDDGSQPSEAVNKK